MVVFAEKASDVGCHRRDHGLAFVRAINALDQGAIIAETAQPNRPEPLGQSRINEVGLGLGQDDTRFRMDEFGNLPEVGPGKREFPVRHGQFTRAYAVAQECLR